VSYNTAKKKGIKSHTTQYINRKLCQIIPQKKDIIFPYVTELVALSVISGFRRDVDEICALLGYYAASSDNPLPTFRDNIGKGLQLGAWLY
jgi:hypothetical protein